MNVGTDYFSVHSRGHMHPGLMMMPGGGGGGVAGGPGGAGAAGAVVGADILSDSAISEEEISGATNTPTDTADGDFDIPSSSPTDEFNNQDIADDPYGTPLNDGGDDSSTTSDSEWASFEEPDYGFTDSPDESTDDEGFGFGGGDDIGGGDEESGGRGLFGLFMSIFTGSDD